MQYVAVVDDKRVVAGPILWRPDFMTAAIGRAGVDVTLPGQAPDQMIQPHPRVKVYPCGEPKMAEGFNEAMFVQTGPFWEYKDGIAYPSYGKQEKTINQIKGYLHDKSANLRKTKEFVDDVVVDIGGETVIFEHVSEFKKELQNLSLRAQTMTSSEKVKWRLGRGKFVTLTKANIQTLAKKLAKARQDLFDWEANNAEKIDAIQSVDEAYVMLDELRKEEAAVKGRAFEQENR